MCLLGGTIVSAVQCRMLVVLPGRIRAEMRVLHRQSSHSPSLIAIRQWDCVTVAFRLAFSEAIRAAHDVRYLAQHCRFWV